MVIEAARCYITRKAVTVNAAIRTSAHAARRTSAMPRSARVDDMRHSAAYDWRRIHSATPQRNALTCRDGCAYLSGEGSSIGLSPAAGTVPFHHATRGGVLVVWMTRRRERSTLRRRRRGHWIGYPQHRAER